MAAIARRSSMAAISASVSLAAADDLNGVQDNTKSFDISGAQRAVVIQHNIGTLGTAGIDVIAISHDGGVTWAAADKVLAMSSDDSTGTELNGILNAAGVEPLNYAAFKCGPYEGPTAIRIFRYVTDFTGSAAWVTGAPAVDMFVVGKGPAAPVALA